MLSCTYVAGRVCNEGVKPGLCACSRLKRQQNCCKEFPFLLTEELIEPLQGDNWLWRPRVWGPEVRDVCRQTRHNLTPTISNTSWNLHRPTCLITVPILQEYCVTSAIDTETEWDDLSLSICVCIYIYYLYTYTFTYTYIYIYIISGTQCWSSKWKFEISV